MQKEIFKDMLGVIERIGNQKKMEENRSVIHPLVKTGGSLTEPCRSQQPRPEEQSPLGGVIYGYVLL